MFSCKNIDLGNWSGASEIEIERGNGGHVTFMIAGFINSNGDIGGKEEQSNRNRAGLFEWLLVLRKK